MRSNEEIDVKDIYQNLDNLRTVSQKDETSAIRSLIAINPDWFYSLMESILDSGYLPIENIIVVKHGAKKYTVHEGNRRAAILKILLGIMDPKDFDLPKNITEQLPITNKQWLKDNKKVPCLVYEPSDQAVVDRIVSLVHAKGEKAGRLKWNSVARAREARDKAGKAQPGLDLLEKYIAKGRNSNQQQKDRWSGDYPMSVLDEVLPKLLPRLKLTSVADVVTKYPSLAQRTELENLLHDIGTGTVGFKEIRADFETTMARIGFPAPTAKGGSGSGGGSGAGAGTGSGSGSGGGGSSGGTGGVSGGGSGGGTGKAHGSDDPKTVTKLLKGFTIHGKNREKVADLRKEALSLKLKDTPLAFCFVLRSMFEISAKAYCDDHGIALQTMKVKKGATVKEDKKLAKLLGEISDHLIAAAKAAGDKSLQKDLHGAKTELTRAEGVLSVTSLNQLVHNPKFSVAASDIARLFTNIFPLLQKMN